MIGKLIVKKNYIKGLIEIPDLSEIYFDEIVKDIKEAIRALQY